MSVIGLCVGIRQSTGRDAGRETHSKQHGIGGVLAMMLAGKCAAGTMDSAEYWPSRWPGNVQQAAWNQHGIGGVLAVTLAGKRSAGSMEPVEYWPSRWPGNA